MNQFVGIGNLTRDPEMRYTGDGTAYTKFTLAINASYKDGETLFMDVTAWGKQAENSAEYLRKGNKAAVVGEVRMDRWEDAEGNKRTKWYCNARNVEFIGGKTERSQPSTPEKDEDLPF